jgi:hypothetical protein
MDMDTMMMSIYEEDLASMKALLAQYQKEICDLRAGTGIAKTMSKIERYSAEKNLEEHIEDLANSIMIFEDKHSFAM